MSATDAREDVNLIDRDNLHPWPEGVTAQLGNYRQGSLIANPPFVYHARASLPIWRASHLLVPTEGTAELVDLDPADCAPYGIITSQDCDIDEANPQPRKPWVQLAPVYELSATDGRLGQMRAWKIHYFAPVSALGECWVADLRIEFPVEKGWLVAQPPQPGFTMPAEYQRFGQFCGDYRRRAALANSIHGAVLTPLEQAVKELQHTAPELYASFRDGVQRLYVDLAGGDPLFPRSVQLVFVGEHELPAALREALDAWWSTAVGGHDLAFAALSNRYSRFDQILLSEERRWIEADLARLESSG